jgi:hypothetical protein
MLEKQNTKEPKDDWRLDKLELEFQSYGEHKGKYAGKIRFQNGDWESFTFKIRPDQAQPYIDLIAENIVKSAESLGERLIDSLGLRK